METNENKSESTAAPDKKSKSSLREWIGLLGGLLLVLLTSALFGVGRAFRSGYLQPFGLENELVPEDFHGYLYWGFKGGVPLLVFWLGIAVICFAIYALCAWIADSLATKWKWVRRLLDWWDAYPKVRPGARHTKYVALAVFALSFGYLLFVVSYALPEAFKTGRRTATKYVQHIASNDADVAGELQWIELHFGENDERIERGYRLLCTDKLCSIYDPAPEHNGVRVVMLEGLKEMRVFAARPNQGGK